MLNRILLGLLSTALTVALLGCGQFNDNPRSDSPGTITINLDGFASQMGGTSALTSPSGDDATTPAKGLVIGAIITTRSTPYTPDLNITGALEDQINDDLARSVNFFQIVKFPTSGATVSFNIPPASAGNWQIAAVGVDPVPDYIADLGTATEFESAPQFRGFTSTFLKSDTVADTTITLNMKRACLNKVTPKGCARYGTDGKPIVTAAVEILDVLVNGSAVSLDGVTFPLIVRSSPGTGEVTASAAVTALSKLVPATGETVTVRTTHQKSGRESSACAGLAPSALPGTCQMQEYTTPFTQ